MLISFAELEVEVKRSTGLDKRALADHLSVLKGWLARYNHGRPHSSLGPGIPKRSVPT
jgi:hypothetical protein